jgi:voltage-gated potassium channel
MIDQVDRLGQRRATTKVAVLVGLRTAVSATALVVAYYLIPVRAKTSAQEVLWLLAALLAFTALIALQLRWIVNSRHPALRAMESLAVAVPLFLVGFARIYLTLSTSSQSFTSELDQTSALYFTITVFSTVGFGDIAPATDFARGIVSVQMILDLVVLGAAGKLLLGAAQRGIAKRDSEQSSGRTDSADQPSSRTDSADQPS